MTSCLLVQGGECKRIFHRYIISQSVLYYGPVVVAN